MAQRFPMFDTPAKAKKKAHEAVIAMLENRMREIRHELWKNRNAMADLVNKSTALKRELAELGGMFRAINPKSAPKA